MRWEEIERQIFASLVEKSQLEVMGERREPNSQLEAERLSLSITRQKRQMGLWRYQTRPHPKQLYFHHARAMTKLFIGGNQTGKTTAILAEATSWALGYYPWSGQPVFHPRTKLQIQTPVRILIGCDDFLNKAGGVLIPKLKELIPWDAMIGHVDRMQGGVIHQLELLPTRSIIKFMSYEQDPAKWESYTWHLALFDEPPPRQLYVSTKRGLMRHDAPIAMGLTPLKEPWIHDELYLPAIHISSEADLSKVKPNDTAAVTVFLDENPYLGEEEKQNFLSSLNPEEIEARRYGRWFHLSGRVYKSFSDEMVVDEDYLEKNAPGWRQWCAGISVDPADRKPYAMGFFVVSPRDEIYFVDEWPNFDFVETRSYDADPNEYKRIIEQKWEELGIKDQVWWLMDPRFGNTIKATTTTTLIQEFNDIGIPFDPEFRVNRLVETRHQKVRKLIAEKRLFVSRKCVNIIRALKSYVWDDYRQETAGHGVKEKPQERFKDFADVVGFVAEAGVSWIDPGSWQPTNPPATWYSRR